MVRCHIDLEATRMTNNAVPSPPRTDAGNAERHCPDDLWALGEKAVARARRWADESASEPVPRSAKLLSRILSDPEGLTFTTRFVDDVVRPTDLDVASTALKRLSAGRSNMPESMQAMCFLAGANSIFYGDKLLTTENPRAGRGRRGPGRGRRWARRRRRSGGGWP